MGMNSYTLLCVDDDAGLRELYAAVLGNYGYKVMLADSGYQALGLFHTRADLIDGVILDYQMPAMNGLELAAELKRQQPTLPIVMISGSDPSLEKRPACVDACFPKGVENGRLIAAIETLITKSRHGNAHTVQISHEKECSLAAGAVAGSR